MEYKFNLEGKTYNIKIEQDKEDYLVSLNGKRQLQVKAINSVSNCVSLVIDGKTTTLYVAIDKGKCYVFVDGNYFTIELEKEKTGRAKSTGDSKGETTVSSPMPGTLVKVPVSIGEEVEIGQTLAIVEAMKMQNELKAGIKGKVKKINFKEGEQVDAFKPIVEVEGLAGKTP